MKYFLICFLWLYAHPSFAQAPPAQTLTADTTRKIEILGARHLRQTELPNGDVLRTLAGNARVRQGNTYLSGDSIVLNNTTGIMEVFGNVHINDADTVNTYAQYLRYVGNERQAYLKKGVKLTDGKGTLFTEDLEYNITSGIATYKNGGRVLNGNTVLTSNGAVYYSDTKDVYFKENVQLNDPKYKISADSLMYNTEFKTAHFIAPTNIESESGNIFTRSGNYNLETGEAFFYDQSVLKDSLRSATGRSIAIDEKTGIVNIEGNGKVVDSANQVILLGGQIFMDQKKNTFLGTRKPVMIFYRDNDSTYIAADTLFSGVKLRDTTLTTKLTSTDTLNIQSLDKAPSDSIRFFEAFHHVRIFNDSLQAVCDSLYYSTDDSIFRLYQQPLVWNGQSQISGDTMYLYTKNQKPDKMEVFFNSFVINHPTRGIFNQISGRTLNAFFTEGKIDVVHVRGNAESIYYPQNDDSAYTGMNRSSGERLYVYFLNQALDKVKFIQQVNGILYPMDQRPADQQYLKGFLWQDNRRPKHKLELFE